MYEPVNKTNGGLLINWINYDIFKPLGIKEDEVLANALKDAHLLKPDTTINGINAAALCNSFLEKKSNYKQLTKLGNILVKNKVITLAQLKEALVEQQKNPSMKLGNFLVSMGACSRADIERCIKSQNQIRDDIAKIEEYSDNITSLRQKLNQKTPE